MNYDLDKGVWILNNIKKITGNSQSQIARDIGVRPQTLSAWKTGKTKSFPIYKKLEKLQQSYKRYAVMIFRQYDGIMGYVFQVWNEEQIEDILEKFMNTGAELIHFKIYKRFSTPVIISYRDYANRLEKEYEELFLNKVDFLSSMVNTIKTKSIRENLVEELGLYYE